MKFIVVILSLFIIVLTAMPCVDVAASDADYYSTLQQDQEHNQTSDVDLCSPFCICQCCQTYAQINIFVGLQVNLEGMNHLAPTLVQNEIKSAISFWRPPKV